ncbi:TetR/AcrR family transcriptional regulator [Bifidobacterium sp. ESL0790]|uniref:TetR/AcrR family transcriptional regulator n=1 Tax=Bifidobacterium sp. ESL0790 TaxID=2983233 RepID=UPI0023F8A745|nr:TetR/AcrR family transcriptional regulator [Bifidobacterium sp. ESL0790]WEV72633.1 TetR/AcrR family transcriptional regulator [Bifidobacterium sp. ESL0790]
MARNAHPEITERRILDAAQKLFLTKGYEKTSIQDILNELGDLSKGAIYHHFDSKKAILDAIGKRDDTKTMARFDEIDKRDDLSGLQKIYEYMWTSDEDMGHMKITGLFTPNLTDPQILRDSILFWARQLPSQWRRFIDEGIDDGSIVTNHPQQVAELLAMLTNLWLIPSIYPATPSQLRERIECIGIMLDALGLRLFDAALIANVTEAVTAMITASGTETADKTGPRKGKAKPKESSASGSEKIDA